MTREIPLSPGQISVDKGLIPARCSQSSTVLSLLLYWRRMMLQEIVSLSGSVGKSPKRSSYLRGPRGSVPLGFLGLRTERTISADMPWFSACVAITVLLAYLDVIELSTVFEAVSVGSVVHAPYSRFAVLARGNMYLLWYVGDRIFSQRLAF